MATTRGSAPLPDWTQILDCTKYGPRSTLANAVTVLQHDPTLGPSVFWFDEFLDQVRLVKSAEREWRDDDDTQLTVYLQKTLHLSSISIASAAHAVQLVARQRTRHCVREQFAAVTWDGVERIAHAIEDYWGADPSAEQPCEYLRAVSANLFLGIVARVLRPGCQLDTMVIFEGPQGIGKSRALRILGGPWYMLAAESVTTKDFFQALPGKLIVEIGEMESFSRAERERVKLAISTPVDRYRSSYGRRAEDHPRQCNFIGTTNRDDYGNDDTGLRRFLPVRCGAINCEALVLARDQLFAEAYRRVLAGETWWETPAAFTLAVQRDRQAEDVWTLTVLEWLVGRNDATSAEILNGSLRIRESEMTRVEQLRIANILRLAGWKRQTIRKNGRPVKGWVAPSVTVTDDSVF
jgi:predicted P-loop ATPase